MPPFPSRGCWLGRAARPFLAHSQPISSTPWLGCFGGGVSSLAGDASCPVFLAAFHPGLARS